MIVLIDANGVIAEVNDKTMEALELPKEGLMGRNFFELFIENPESRNSYLQQFEHCKMQRAGTIDMQPHQVYAAQKHWLI